MTAELSDRISELTTTLNVYLEESRRDRAAFEARLEETNSRFTEEVKRWDERFFQFSRDSVNTSRTIIIAAAAALVFAPLFQALAPVIENVALRLLDSH